VTRTRGTQGAGAVASQSATALAGRRLRRTWLDVGCGTGALTATVLAEADPAQVVDLAMSAKVRDPSRSAHDDLIVLPQIEAIAVRKGRARELVSRV